MDGPGPTSYREDSHPHGGENPVGQCLSRNSTVKKISTWSSVTNSAKRGQIYLGSSFKINLRNHCKRPSDPTESSLIGYVHLGSVGKSQKLTMNWRILGFENGLRGTGRQAGWNPRALEMRRPWGPVAPMHTAMRARLGRWPMATGGMLPALEV